MVGLSEISHPQSRLVALSHECGVGFDVVPCEVLVGSVASADLHDGDILRYCFVEASSKFLRVDPH